MVKLLEADEVDVANEAVDAVLTEAEEAEAHQRFAPSGEAGDLSDGGMVNGARLRPMQSNGRLGERGKESKGRPAARRAWMWNGTETVLPLAWNPDGTIHDGARRYLLKKHCMCCGGGGFRGFQCPKCIKDSCTRCKGSSDRSKIIPAFYLSKDAVPFPERFYGDIPCFLQFCPRRDDRGFKTEQEMRMHARSRHRMEYQAHIETLAATRMDDVQRLQEQVDALINRGAQPVETKAVSADQPTPAQQRMAKARAAKKQRAAVSVA